MFKKIKNKSVVQTVVDSITKAIIAGELKPGDKIPTELELAESFGVGRNSIREAIKILVYYGILREMMEVGVMRLAIAKYNEEDIDKIRDKLENLKKEIEKGPENIENVFIADNVFHDTVSEMGHNPIVDRINNVVREMTYKMRYRSMLNMLESGRGEELYDAHEKIYKKILNRDLSNLNEDIRRTYFPEEADMDNPDAEDL